MMANCSVSPEVETAQSLRRRIVARGAGPLERFSDLALGIESALFGAGRICAPRALGMLMDHPSAAGGAPLTTMSPPSSTRARVTP